MKFAVKFAVLIEIGLTFSLAGGAEFPARVSSANVPALLQSTAFVRGLSETDLVKLVPEQSGLHYVGCPNCNGGRQENQLVWSTDRPDEVYCQYCQHRYPSPKYPATESVTVKSPRGQNVSFPYWADQNGYRYFFHAHRDDEVREYLAARARELGMLYAATRDPSHARRAALILDRFAQVFPGWCFHYDYPFQQKEIYDGDVPPHRFRSGYRTARWTWWAYSDIPSELVQTYDWVRDSDAFTALSAERGLDVAGRIERDLFRNACEQVMANPEPLTNMSPTAWYAMVQLGRILREPRYVHEVVNRLQAFVDTQFLYDGTWHEGSPDYASQTLRGLDRVLSILNGYSDPPGYVHPGNGTRLDQLDLRSKFPALGRAETALRQMRLPDGRAVPVHDTWPTSRRGNLDRSESFLLPALGHACIGHGSAESQTQVHLTWSGGYGHSHADNLSLILFSHGRELLSDIGYTHTAYRPWATASVAHNTVVIDGRSQTLGGKESPSDGSLLMFDTSDSRVQVVSAEGKRGYPGLAKLYCRTLIVVDAGNGNRYVVDVFQVDGGRVHDYFLHGDADRPTSVATDLQVSPLDSLLPTSQAWTPTRNEGEVRRVLEPHYAYGFLRDLKSGLVARGANVSATFRGADAAVGGLRVSFVPDSSCRLVVGTNPSVRPAEENDARLDQFVRPFTMLRHESDSGRSTFVAVLEPFRDLPFIDSVERLKTPGDTIGVKIQFGNQTHVVVVDGPSLAAMAELRDLTLAQPDTTKVEIPLGSNVAGFQGTVGVLCLRADTVDHAYSWHAYLRGQGGWTFGNFQKLSSRAQTAQLIGIRGDELELKGPGTNPPKAGDIVRLVTSDGWVYPFHTSSVSMENGQLRLKIAEGDCLRYQPENQEFSLISYPQRTHLGLVRANWVPR